MLNSPALAGTAALTDTPAMLQDERTSPQQYAALRAMTGVQRWQLAEQLYWSARRMKRAGLRRQHPDWSVPQVEAEVRRIFTHGGDV